MTRPFQFKGLPKWLALLALAAGSALLALWLFPKAMPLLTVQMDMSLAQAHAAAGAFQQAAFPELKTSRSAAQFERDEELQNYIELEGGGVDTYAALLKQPFVSPYYWTVRRFAELQEEELTVWFTPQGSTYGFSLKVPEKTAGAALDEAAARALAETAIKKLLGEGFLNGYSAHSASQTKRSTGRIDHVFEYENQTEKRADARFRVKAVVTGNRVSKVQPYAFIPQAFGQRFSQMREGNESIARTATVGLFGVFGIGGIVGGWFWLSRQRTLRWRAALVGAGVLGALQTAHGLSNLPLNWMGYITTQAESTFLFAALTGALMEGVVTTLMLGVLFVVAEGLSRHAFSGHPSLFAFWSPQAGASPQALGRTIGGYAWMAFELLLVSAFYLVARSYLGWWVPMESLTDPNILSAWQPAFGPIAQAAMAGTMEESLCRAIPLAGAVLLGRRYGAQRVWVGFALLLQAIVFAGAHANYPGLPSYSRLVELFLPAVIWGVIFLRFGLVPCIVMHFTFDLVLMSLPLFVAVDAGLWTSRLLVIAAGLLPLAMIARARLKQGHFAELPDALRNGEVQAAALQTTGDEGADVPSAVVAPQGSVAPMLPRWLAPLPLAIAAVAGVLLLIAFYPKGVATPVLSIDRTAAIATAEAVLAQRSVQLDDGWKRVARIAPAGDGDTSVTRFVWREAGADTFNRLLQSGDIAGPHWRIAFRHVQGPVEERAESWEVALSGDGKVVAVFHNLPEGRAGKKLAREEALALVQQFIAGNPALAGRPWELAVADQHERTARRDWVFRFDDKNALNVQGGFSRVSLNVRGDEVDAWRHVYVPDEWQRTQEAEQARKKPGKIISGLSIAGVLLIGVLVVLRRVGDGYRPMGLGLTGVALVFISSTTAYLLRFNERTLGFDPAQDWGSQVMTTIAMRTTFTLLLALLAAAMFMQYRGLVRVGAQRAVAQLLTGAALAMALQGAVSALYAALPVTDPALYDAGNSASVQPWLSTLAAGLMNAVLAVALVAVCAGVLAFCKTKVRTICVVAVLGIALLGTLLSADTLLAGIGQTVSLVLVAGLVVQLLKRSLGGIAVSFASVMSLDLPAKLLAVPVADAPLQAVLLVLTTTLATLACLRVFQGSAAGVAE